MNRLKLYVAVYLLLCIYLESVTVLSAHASYSPKAINKGASVSLDYEGLLDAVAAQDVPLSRSERLHRKIRKRMEDASSGDDVFRIAEDIPAIQRCTDKALSIAQADEDDAVTAVLAIHRLASLCVEPNKWAIISSDRRFEQLADCVDLQLEHLATLDMCKYLWAMSVVRVSDEERSRAVFEEFLNRLKGEENLPVGHISTMLWTVGCIRNNLGWTDEDLFAQLRDALFSKPLESLNNRLLIRILWTLLVHKDQSETTRGLMRKVVSLLHSSDGYKVLSTHHISTMLLACSDMSLACDATSRMELGALLTTLRERIEEEEFGPGEVDLASQALSATYVGIENLLQEIKCGVVRAPKSEDGRNDEDKDKDSTKCVDKEEVSQLSELALQVQEVTGCLLSFSLEKLPQLGLDSCAALMQATVAVLPTSELSKDFIEASVCRIVEFMPQAYQEHRLEWSPSVSAFLLDSVSRLTWNVRPEIATSVGVFGKDRLDVELMQAKRQRQQRESQSDSDRGATIGLTAFQRWQKVAGFCSAMCSLQADNINDMSLLINAAHGCEAYHRPCPVMLAQVKKSFLVDGISVEAASLDPSHFARLAGLIVAMQRVQKYGSHRGLTCSQEDLALVARQLVILTRLIPSVAERMGALISASYLASKEVQASSFYKDFVQETGLNFDTDGLSTVRTRTLVRFLQSDVPKSEAMATAVTKVLRKRKVDIATAESLFLTDESNPSTRLSLLAQLLLDWHAHRNCRTSRTDEGLLRSLVECVKEAIRDTLPPGMLEVEGAEFSVAPSLAEAGNRLDEGGGYVRVGVEEEDGAGTLGASVDLIALSQVLQVLSTHNWRDEELASLVGLYTEATIDQGIDSVIEQSSEGCRRLFDLGRLEGFLQHYSHVNGDNCDPRISSKVFGFASGVARTFIPHIRNAFAGIV